MARHLSVSVFCNFYRLEVPGQALGGILLSFGIEKYSELLCTSLFLAKQEDDELVLQIVYVFHQLVQHNATRTAVMKQSRIHNIKIIDA